MPVYVIRAGATDRVKIGFSDDVPNRMVKMQADNHERLVLLRTLDGGRDVERALHRSFRKDRVHGEWFAFNPAMMTHDGTPPREAPVKVTITDPGGDLLKEIEAFLPRRRIAESTFGRLAVNDGKFVSRLRARANMTLATIDRARDFIRDQAPVSVQSQGGEAA